MPNLGKSAKKVVEELIQRHPDNFGEVIGAIQHCPELSYMVEKNIARGAK